MSVTISDVDFGPNRTITANNGVNTEIINATNYRSNNGTAGLIIPNTGAIQLQTSRSLDMNNNTIFNCTQISNLSGNVAIAGLNSGLTIGPNSFVWGSTFGSATFSNSTGVNISTGSNPITLSENIQLPSIPTATGTTLVVNGNQVSRASSARKYKENIIPLSIDTAKIFDLVSYEYNFKNQSEKTTIGMIADEVNEILPIVVQKNRENEPESINYELLVVPIIEELKKLRNRINVLEGN